ncbi:hypothetical protein [Olleya aquimaris]|uniref:Adhesin domain-containing protein n=1 Tax=Olleya aquimaris TaxID=639310 RepID=A0A327R6A0_9FLAO|nr:hypothetical protein [Olleya aquimaris]RAJ12151.1 hypothetical protein LY08_02404 [Olleya aquimaris]
MKDLLIVLLFFISVSLCAQKTTEKSWSAKTINTLTIDGNNIFKIKVSNNDSNTISLKVKIEGEYAEQLVILDSLSEDKITISSSFQPLFIRDNDKLSAHKVLSVEYELTVPKHVNLNIKSDIASVQIAGHYPSVFIELNQGNCDLKQFIGNATINTIEGHITIETNNAKIEAFTKTGTKHIKQFKYANHQISCHTINGNIKVSKIEK